MISGTTQVTSPIAPTSIIDIYATHDAAYGKDGLRNVLTLSDRNAISDLRRVAGMIVGVLADDSYWRLKNIVWDGTDNDWEPFLTGGGSTIGLTQVAYGDSLTGAITSSSNFVYNSDRLTLGAVGLAGQRLQLITTDGSVGWMHSTNVVNLLSYIASNRALIGTNTNHDLGFTTNGQERMTILTNGNVSIGTTNAYGKLNIFDSSIARIELFYNTTNRFAQFLTPDANAALGISSYFDDKVVFIRTNVAGTSNGFSFVLDSGNGDFTINSDYVSGASSTVMIFERSSLNFGFGTGAVSPTAKVHVKGIDSTSSNYTLKVDNSVSSPLLYVRNDGASEFKSYFDGTGIGNPNYSFSTSLGGNLINIVSIGGSRLNFIDNGNARFEINSSDGFANFKAKYRIALKSLDDNKSHIWMESSTGFIGIGNDYFVPDYQLHVNGISLFNGTNTGSYFNFGAGEETFIRAGKTGSKVYINNSHNGSVEIAGGGGNVAIGGNATTDKLTVYGSTYLGGDFSVNNYVAAFHGLNTSSFFNYGTNQNVYIRAGKTDQDIYLQDNHNGLVGVGTTSVSARLQVKGIDSTSSNYALKVDNSSSNIFSIRNDGLSSFNNGDLNIYTSGGISILDVANYKSLKITMSGSYGDFITFSHNVGDLRLHRPVVIMGGITPSGNNTVEIGLNGGVSSIGVRNISLSSSASGYGMFAIGQEFSGGTYGTATLRFKYDPASYGASVNATDNNYFRVGIGVDSVSTHRVIIADGLKVSTGFLNVGSTTTVDGNDTTNYPISIRSVRNDLTRIQILNGGATQTDIQIGTNNGANSIYYGVTSTNSAFIDNRTSGHLLFQNTGTTNMTFTTTGKLGIGLTPNAFIDVLGDASSNLLKLNNSVFAFCDKLRISNDGSFFSSSDNSNYAGTGDSGTGDFITGHLNYVFKTSYSTYLAFSNAGGAGNKSSYGIIGGPLASSDSDYKLVILNSDIGTLGSILKLISTASSTVNDGFDYYTYNVNFISHGTYNNTGSGTFYKVGLNVDISGGDVNYAAIFNGGLVSIGNVAPTSSLDITGVNGYSQLRLRTTYTPTSSADTNGNIGDTAWDDSYVYIKVSTGWKRATLNTF